MGLPDGHDGGGGGRGGGQGGQNDGEAQLQSQYKIGDDKYQNGGQNRFKNGDHRHLRPAFFQGVELEKLAGAESDKGQGDIGDEIHAANYVFWHQIQAVGANENARDDVGRHIGQPQTFCDPGGGKAAD